jgi:hypothetical protein
METMSIKKFKPKASVSTYRGSEVHEVKELFQDGDHDDEVVLGQKFPDLSFVILAKFQDF